MKFRPVILSLTACIAFASYGQVTQRGVVKEYKGRKEATHLAGVTLDVAYAGSSVSDKKGNFTLTFNTRKPGDRVTVRKIDKDKYEIFNKDAVEQWTISPQVPFEVIMCRSDQFRNLCDNYYSSSSASYKRQRQKEEERIARLQKEGKIKEEEYRAELRRVEDDYERALSNLDTYIEKFARINLSKLQDEEAEIIELVQAGKIDEAIDRYESMNLVSKIENEVQDKHAIVSDIEKLQAAASQKDTNIESLLESLDRQITTLQLHGASNIPKIATIYSSIAPLLPENIQIQIKAGKFFQEYVADFVSALKCFNQALSSSASRFGEESSSVAISCNNIASVYNSLGENNRALEYYKKSLAINLKLFGEDHPSVANSYNNLGYTYQSLGAYDKAMVYYIDGLRIRLRHSGKQDEVVATLYNNIGFVYSALGEYDKSLEYYIKALNIRIKLLGEQHQKVAVSYNNIGTTYNYLHDYENALLHFNKALETQLKLYGNNHPTVAVTYNNIGATLDSSGKHENALEYHNKALDIRIKLFGSKHPETATSYNNIGLVYNRMGQYGKALEYFNLSLKIRLMILGDGNPSIAHSYNNIGYALARIGSYQEAYNNYIKALDIYKKTLPDNHPSILKAKKSIEYLERKMRNN